MSPPCAVCYSIRRGTTADRAGRPNGRPRDSHAHAIFIYTCITGGFQNEKQIGFRLGRTGRRHRLVVLGIFTFARPSSALTGIVFVYGLLAVVTGIADIAFYVKIERHTGFGPVVSLITGILSILAGVLLLFNPGAVKWAMALLFPLWFIMEQSRKTYTHEKTLSGKRSNSEASAFDQWREVMVVGGVSPTSVVIGLDPAEDGLANRIPLHAGAVEAVDQFLLERCEKTLHARVVKAAMRAAHTLAYGAEPGDHDLYS